MVVAEIKKVWYKQRWAIVLFTIIGFILFVSIISGNPHPNQESNSATPNHSQTLSQIPTQIPSENICVPNWQCHDWSECNSGGIQTRDCFDLNYCYDTKGKPAESQSCKYYDSMEEIRKNPQNFDKKEVIIKGKLKPGAYEPNYGEIIQSVKIESIDESIQATLFDNQGYYIKLYNINKTHTRLVELDPLLVFDNQGYYLYDTYTKQRTYREFSEYEIRGTIYPLKLCSPCSGINCLNPQNQKCDDNNYYYEPFLKVEEITKSNTTSLSESDNASLSNAIQHIDSEPYYSVYCKKIDPFDLDVRETASRAVRNHSGKYNILQVLDIYDWVKDNIIYLNVPVTLSGSPYNPSETLKTKSGDCKNQAVLLASMIDSIGGAAKVVLIPECEHAYVLVYFTNNESGFNELLYDTQRYYNKPLSFSYYKENDNFWVKFDTAGGMFPGETLPECEDVKEVYTVSSCASMHS